MKITLCTVGGFDEVGRNMSSFTIGNETVLCDMGFDIKSLASFEEQGNHRSSLTRETLITQGIIPDDRVLHPLKSTVKMIAASHAHLDHIGAIPYLAPAYKAPVYGTPYTLSVLNTMMRDDQLSLTNPLRTVQSGDLIKISKNLSVEFIHVTHSTPQSSLIALHTPKGVVLYATDFKFDDTPIVGDKPDYAKIKQLAEKRVIAVVVDSLYSGTAKSMPSEAVARDMLRNVLLDLDTNGRAIVATCFASNIARLRSLIDIGNSLGRKVVFLGRSLLKYCTAAEEAGVAAYSKEVNIVPYPRSIRRVVSQIEKEGPENYLIVCTGGQGEPTSVFRRLVSPDHPFHFSPDDYAVFSNRIIPVEPNISNRLDIERRLKRLGVQVFTDVHVSGHCGGADIRKLVHLLHPEHLIPCHGNHALLSPLEPIAAELGYTLGKNLHFMHNGKTLRFE